MSKKYIGVVALIAVGFFYGLSGMLAKYVTGFASPLQATEIRFLLALLLSLLVLLILRKGVALSGLSRPSLLLYSLAFPLCVLFFTLSIFYSSVAIATASAYGAALLSSFVLGRVFFGEGIGAAKGLAFVITLFALLIFTEPWQDFSLSLGLVFGVVSGVLQGASNSVQKSLNRSGADHFSLLLLQCLAGAMLCLLVLGFAGETPLVFPDGANPLLLVLYGGSSLITVYLFLVGFKYVDVNTGSILVSSQLFFGPALAWLFLQEGIEAHVVLGGALVLVAGALANWPKADKPRPV